MNKYRVFLIGGHDYITSSDLDIKEFTQKTLKKELLLLNNATIILTKYIVLIQIIKNE